MDTNGPNSLSIDALKARYAELQAKGQKEAPERRATVPPELGANAIRECETIPAGWYRSFRVSRGEGLRFVNQSGTPGIALQIWNADDPSERFYAGDTVKVQWSAAIGEGWLLLSDMGRALAAVTADPFGRHDAIGGISLPGGEGMRNTRDNFLVGAAKLGLSRRDVHPALQLFADIRTNAEGALAAGPERPAPGTALDFRAEMNLLILVSNTPHPMLGSPHASGPIEVIRFADAVALPDDFSRTRTEEARRAMDNTLAYFGEVGDLS